MHYSIDYTKHDPTHELTTLAARVSRSAFPRFSLLVSETEICSCTKGADILLEM